MQRQKIVITLYAEELQNIERITADRDSALAVDFVMKVLKPRSMMPWTKATASRYLSGATVRRRKSSRHR
jgi:hypothetical protein